MADGMWVVHAVCCLWVAAGSGLGLWGCLIALRPDTSAPAQRILVVAGLAIAFTIGAPALIMWKNVTRAIVLQSGGVRMGKTVVPYEDIVCVGLSQGGRGDLVLTAECDSATGRVRRDISLPRWVASHSGFLEELRQRAPRMVLRREGLRRRAITLFANGVFLLWCTVAAALLAVYYVPPWRAGVPWLTSVGLTAILVAGSVVCLIYVVVAAG